MVRQCSKLISSDQHSQIVKRQNFKFKLASTNFIVNERCIFPGMQSKIATFFRPEVAYYLYQEINPTNNATGKKKAKEKIQDSEF